MKRERVLLDTSSRGVHLGHPVDFESHVSGYWVNIESSELFWMPQKVFPPLQNTCIF